MTSMKVSMVDNHKLLGEGIIRLPRRVGRDIVPAGRGDVAGDPGSAGESPDHPFVVLDLTVPELGGMRA
jgi:hypothetical protein